MSFSCCLLFLIAPSFLCDEYAEPSLGFFFFPSLRTVDSVSYLLLVYTGNKAKLLLVSTGKNLPELQLMNRFIKDCSLSTETVGQLWEFTLPLNRVEALFSEAFWIQPLAVSLSHDRKIRRDWEINDIGTEFFLSYGLFFCILSFSFLIHRKYA